MNPLPRLLFRSARSSKMCITYHLGTDTQTKEEKRTKKKARAHTTVLRSCEFVCLRGGIPPQRPGLPMIILDSTMVSFDLF